MGTRIHKMLGYGLTDVKTNSNDCYRFRDGRLNRTGILRADWDEQQSRWTLEAYKDWLQDRRDNLGEDVDFLYRTDLGWERHHVADAQAPNRRVEISDCFIHQPEFGLPNVLCCIPICERNNWYRYDDMIDYVEESCFRNPKHNPCRDFVEVFEENFYPWTGLYWDIRDGRRLDAGESCAYRRLVNAEKTCLELEQPSRGGYEEECEAMARTLEFESHDDLQKHMAPMVPSYMQFLIEFCEVFTDPSVVRQLRPMMYVYWG